jgi:hypothetical protein
MAYEYEENPLAEFAHKHTTKERLELLKEVFRKRFDQAIKTERTHCMLTNQAPHMTTGAIKLVERLLDKCRDCYEIEAMERILYVDNTPLESFNQIAVVADEIKKNLMRG